MNTCQKTLLEKYLPPTSRLFRWFMTLMLVLTITSCTEKVQSQETSITPPIATPPQISRKFEEIATPDVIQELRPVLEGYQPQIKIITPEPDQILEDSTVKVSLQIKDLPIFKDPQWQLGNHLHLILDNQPYKAIYDVNQPVVLPDLLAGTHTLRVFASRPWHESFKNEGAYAQVTFHIFTKTDDNNPDPSLPLLTYSRPNDKYGAEPILLDFYLTNAPLHLVAKDNPEDKYSDWRIRSTVNGESFILDKWQSVYLNGFKPGKNWIKLEFLDNQGNPLKNVFNSTARVITYEPKGQDTLSRIVRGELTADQVRGIVDQKYASKIPSLEPTPTAIPAVETKPTIKLEVEKSPNSETKNLEVPKTQPTIKLEVEKSPNSETKNLEVPKTQPTIKLEVEKSPNSETKNLEVPKTQPTIKPEVEKSPNSETKNLEVSKTQPNAKPEVEKSPNSETKNLEVSKTQPNAKLEVQKSPIPQTENLEVSKTQPTTKPEIEKSPIPQTENLEVPKTQPTTKPEIEKSPIPQTENLEVPNNKAEVETKSTVKSQIQKSPSSKTEVRPGEVKLIETKI